MRKSCLQHTLPAPRSSITVYGGTPPSPATPAPTDPLLSLLHTGLVHPSPLLSSPLLKAMRANSGSDQQEVSAHLGHSLSGSHLQLCWFSLFPRRVQPVSLSLHWHSHDWGSRLLQRPWQGSHCTCAGGGGVLGVGATLGEPVVQTGSVGLILRFFFRRDFPRSLFLSLRVGL